MKQIRIAFTGISGSGKDHLVNHLVEKYGFTRLSFSDQLKRIAHKIYPWLEQDYPAFEKEQPLNITLPSGEKITKSPREIWLSLNKLRENEDGVFVRMLEAELGLLNVDRVVISDIRPQVEWDWCQENGFTTIFVEPTKKIYDRNSFDDSVLEYKDKVDYGFINNFNGTEEFDEFIKKVIDEK